MQCIIKCIWTAETRVVRDYETHTKLPSNWETELMGLIRRWKHIIKWSIPIGHAMLNTPHTIHNPSGEDWYPSTKYLYKVVFQKT